MRHVGDAISDDLIAVGRLAAIYLGDDVEAVPAAVSETLDTAHRALHRADGEPDDVTRRAEGLWDGLTAVQRAALNTRQIDSPEAGAGSGSDAGGGR